MKENSNNNKTEGVTNQKQFTYEIAGNVCYVHNIDTFTYQIMCIWKCTLLVYIQVLRTRIYKKTRNTSG